MTDRIPSALGRNAILIRTMEMLRIANEAVAEAIAENERLGIPECFWKAGKMYYVTPEGELTTERPAILRGTDGL